MPPRLHNELHPIGDEGRDGAMTTVSVASVRRAIASFVTKDEIMHHGLIVS
jgi:hypothetical protein